MKHLTKSMKIKYFPLILQRDGKFICFYCSKPLEINDFIYEHLNDDREYNEIENIVFACYSCNNKKSDSSEMQKKALKKLKENEKGNFMRERKFEGEIVNEASTEIEINTSNYDLTKEFLMEKTAVGGSIRCNDALNVCTCICKEKTGHGSQQSVRNYIASLTSSVGPLEVSRDGENKKIIVRRVITVPNDLSRFI